MLQLQGLRSSRDIERMAWLAAGGEAQGHQRNSRRQLCSDQAQHLLITLSPTASVAPTQPEGVGHSPTQLPDAVTEPAIVVTANRIAAAPQQGRTAKPTKRRSVGSSRSASARDGFSPMNSSRGCAGSQARSSLQR